MVPNDTFIWENLFIWYNDDKEYERICNENLAFPDLDYEIYKKNLTCNLYKIEKPIAEIQLILSPSHHNPFKDVLNIQ